MKTVWIFEIHFIFNKIGSTSKKNNSKSKEGVYLLCESNKVYAGWCTVAHCERTEVK